MSENSTRIGELVEPAQVRARVPVGHWSEAVAVAGTLLTETGVCAPAYVAAMQDAVRNLGPYMVVAPGVAMPHARPEAGVLTPGVAVVTLAEPVKFGHKANDPVDLLIAFAAVDKDAHLGTLQLIVDLLQNEPILAAVRAAGTDKELHAALRGSVASLNDSVKRENR